MWKQPVTKDITSNNTTKKIDSKVISRARVKMKNTSKQGRQVICLPKFTSSKKATSPLRFPQREGYHKEPLASPIHHKGKLVLTKKTPQRRGNTNIPGCSTHSRVLHTEKALNGRRLTV
jgi:hypothetical protein